MITISLESFVSRFKKQEDAAKQIGCNQANISKHLKEIRKGSKQVLVSLDGEAVKEVAIVKGLNSSTLRMRYLPSDQINSKGNKIA